MSKAAVSAFGMFCTATWTLKERELVSELELFCHDRFHDSLAFSSVHSLRLASADDR